jgi:MscS family membrane protein
MEKHSDEDLVRALSYVFNQQNITNLADINDTPEGNLKDGLPDYREKVGAVAISTGDIPIYLQRVPDGEGGRIWKVSNAPSNTSPPCGRNWATAHWPSS